MFNQLFKNKPLVLTLLVVFILIPLTLLFLSLRNAEDKFQLVSVSPTKGSAVDPTSAVVEFEFNQELLTVQKSTFAVVVEPAVKYTYGVLNNKLRVNLNDLLLIDNQTYTITLLNAVSRNDEIVKSASSQIVVDLEQKTVDFLNSLPHSSNGFTVAKISDNTLLVRITKEPASKYSTSAINLLDDNGLYSTVFNVALSLPSQQDDFNESGIRH